MMDVLDGLYYTYYWMFRNDGEPKWGALVSALIRMNGITLPYVGIIWFIALLLPDDFTNSLGIDIPMYFGFFFVFVFLCIRFGWRKRYLYIISKHDMYDNTKYKRLGRRGMIAMWIGVLILFILSFIKLHENAAANQ